MPNSSIRPTSRIKSPLFDNDQCMNIRQLLDDRLTTALTIRRSAQRISHCKPSARPEFGDYQANGVMAVAKQLQTNPRELASRLIAHVDLSDIADKLEVVYSGLSIFI